MKNNANYFKIIIFFALYTGFTGFASLSPAQMLGRMAPESPKTLEIGKNKISFFSQGTRIVGDVFVPMDFKKGDTLPALIMVAPESGVKEQSPGDYAKRLSEKGYITLAFDHRTYGESDGAPRSLEDPFMKIEDIKNAVSFMRSLKEVDKQKIGVIGICSGACYATAAAAFDIRIKSVATVSGVFDFVDYKAHGRTEFAKKYFAHLLTLAGDARQKFFETGEIDYEKGAFYGEAPEDENKLKALFQNAPAAGKVAIVFWQRAYDYYHTSSRGQVPTWRDQRLLSALDARFAINATSTIHLLSPRPFLSVKGSKAISGAFSDIAFKKAGEPKEIHIIEGANHFDLYDNDRYLKPVVEKLALFFNTTLKPEKEACRLQ